MIEYKLIILQYNGFLALLYRLIFDIRSHQKNLWSLSLVKLELLVLFAFKKLKALALNSAMDVYLRIL